MDTSPHGKSVARLDDAGSSGGTAVAVSASLVTLGLGTDTCNSLSNPAAFASLATIRTTRGLTSRDGVMPLNTYAVAARFAACRFRLEE